MTAHDYIPKAHNQFFVWQTDFYDRAQQKLSSFQIDAAKFSPVTAAKSKYELAFHRASNPDGANTADRVERDEREAEYKTVIRQFVNECIRYNSRVSDYDKKYLGLTVPDHTPTPAPVPTTVPALKVDFSKTEQHTIRVEDEEKAGKAKPKGVHECEIWYAIDPQEPAHDSAYTYAGSATAHSLVLHFDADQRGKRVYYKARWVNTRGEHGPWSIAIDAIVG